MTSRERFEEWAQKRAFDLARYPGDPAEYNSSTTDYLWTGWQAALDSLDVEAAARVLYQHFRPTDGFGDGPFVLSEWSERARAILAAAKGE